MWPSGLPWFWNRGTCSRVIWPIQHWVSHLLSPRWCPLLKYQGPSEASGEKGGQAALATLCHATPGTQGTCIAPAPLEVPHSTAKRLLSGSPEFPLCIQPCICYSLLLCGPCRAPCAACSLNTAWSPRAAIAPSVDLASVPRFRQQLRLGSGSLHSSADELQHGKRRTGAASVCRLQTLSADGPGAG